MHRLDAEFLGLADRLESHRERGQYQDRLVRAADHIVGPYELTRGIVSDKKLIGNEQVVRRIDGNANRLTPPNRLD